MSTASSSVTNSRAGSSPGTSAWPPSSTSTSAAPAVRSVSPPISRTTRRTRESTCSRHCSAMSGWGETVTYGELAEMAGRPRAARFVGNVMARNPVPIIIPCHRVVAANRRIGGYGPSGAGDEARAPRPGGRHRPAVGGTRHRPVRVKAVPADRPAVEGPLAGTADHHPAPVVLEEVVVRTDPPGVLARGQSAFAQGHDVIDLQEAVVGTALDPAHRIGGRELAAQLGRDRAHRLADRARGPRLRAP